MSSINSRLPVEILYSLPQIDLHMSSILFGDTTAQGIESYWV